MLLDQIRSEAIVTCRNWGMGGEDGSLGDFSQRVVKGQAIVAHPFANHFEWSKGAMTFIQVINPREDAQGT